MGSWAQATAVTQCDHRFQGQRDLPFGPISQAPPRPPAGGPRAPTHGPARRLGVRRGRPALRPASGLELGGEGLLLLPPAALGARALPEPREAEPGAGDPVLPAAGEGPPGRERGRTAGRLHPAVAGDWPCCPPCRTTPARPRRRRAGNTAPWAPSSTWTLSPRAGSAAAAGTAGWPPTRTRASHPCSSWRDPW